MTVLRKALPWTTVRETFFRLAASGYLPARLFVSSAPGRSSLFGRTGELSLEVVTHCWKYDHLLAYQLSSLASFPPARGSVRATVFYAPEDERTAALLEWFGRLEVPRVQWNWQPLDRSLLMRRAIGRNMAARATEADWIWFTDCDVIFHEGCLDGLFDQLQGCREPLVYPRQEHITPLLRDGHPLLAAAAGNPQLVHIDPAEFQTRACFVAKGPYQIAHGDVARALGYCEALSVFHEPSDGWRKAHEDRAFRWLLRSQGFGIDIPAIYRIRHASKGRYQGSRAIGWIRGAIRRVGAGLAAQRVRA
ncbi:MAG TPA: glycosyltransferase family 2 protein [Thermoanaerobaculia bacterium]|nr:glycosyltransferase family 2 protein [Thermoanaerobaculia bacterium]